MTPGEVFRSRALARWLQRPGTRIAVAGATGWIGRAVIESVLAAAPDIAADRLVLLGSRASQLTMRGRGLEVSPLDETAARAEGEWLVLHAAILGAERLGGDLARTREANDTVLQQVLSLAERLGSSRLVFFSSGAAHRPDHGGPAKQAYGRMKADHEAVVAAWAERRGCSLVMPRVFNLGGPYINHLQAYALGDFILAARRQGRIGIGAVQPVFRSYVHVCEMAGLVLDMAVTAAGSRAPFDVGGAEVVELGALARKVGAALGLADIPVDRAPPSGAEPDWYVGDGRVYQAALFEAGGRPAALDRIIADTVAYIGGLADG